MKRCVSAILAVSLLLAAALAAAQEQRPGEPLYLPKEDTIGHPSDLHMGSDPYYRPGQAPAQGSDAGGYPQRYDPQQERVERTYVPPPAPAPVPEPEDVSKPPSRWNQ
jgi:hypothetical protein